MFLCKLLVKCNFKQNIYNIFIFHSINWLFYRFEYIVFKGDYHILGQKGQIIKQFCRKRMELIMEVIIRTILLAYYFLVKALCFLS